MTAGLQTQRPESQGPEMPAGSQSHLGSLGKEGKKVRSQLLMRHSLLKSAAQSEQHLLATPFFGAASLSNRALHAFNDSCT